MAAARLLAIAQSGALGGAELALMRVARRLGEHGFEMTLAVPFDGPLAAAAAAEGVHVTELPLGPLRRGGWPRAVASWPRARTLVARQAPQLVLLNGGAPLRLAPALGRVPRVVWLHDLLAAAPRAWRSSRSWERTPILLATSRAVARRAEELGAPGERLRVVHAPLEPVQPAPRPPWRDGGPVVGFAGRIEERKGVLELIEAMAALRGRRPGARLVIAGAGDAASARYERVVRAAAARLGDDVVFLGHVDSAASLMSWFDALALPSREEPLGLAALEALAAGTPVVATRSGGPEEYVVPGRTGELVPPGDPDALAAALDRVLDRAEAMAGACRAEAERFSVDRVVPAFVSALREALER